MQILRETEKLKNRNQSLKSNITYIMLKAVLLVGSFRRAMWPIVYSRKLHLKTLKKESVIILQLAYFTILKKSEMGVLTTVLTTEDPVQSTLQTLPSSAKLRKIDVQAPGAMQRNQTFLIKSASPISPTGSSLIQLLDRFEHVDSVYSNTSTAFKILDLEGVFEVKMV
eukprot:EST49597.1 Hypothetical protein SS50377_10040 [Spironucleus salmonicida]